MSSALSSPFFLLSTSVPFPVNTSVPEESRPLWQGLRYRVLALVNAASNRI